MVTVKKLKPSEIAKATLNETQEEWIERKRLEILHDWYGSDSEEDDFSSLKNVVTGKTRYFRPSVIKDSAVKNSKAKKSSDIKQ